MYRTNPNYASGGGDSDSVSEYSYTSYGYGGRDYPTNIIVDEGGEVNVRASPTD